MTRLTDAEDPRPTVVYSLFDASGNLLYIGVSSDFGMRLTHHRSPFINPWADLVDHWTTEEFPTRAEARQVERELIARLSPRCNKNHKRREPLDVTPRGKDNAPLEPAEIPGRAALLALFDSFATKTPAGSENPRSDSAA